MALAIVLIKIVFCLFCVSILLGAWVLVVVGGGGVLCILKKKIFNFFYLPIIFVLDRLDDYKTHAQFISLVWNNVL